VPKGPARIIVLGRSKNRSKKINKFLSEIFTQEIPAEFVSKITLKYEDGEETVLSQITNDVIIEDLNWVLKHTDRERLVEEVEIIVELDVIQSKITNQATTLLNKFFTDE
tara:strand:+ start:1388 stop:1717 length:330 start_codon:yes stop_codon:yes gene_type:complete